MNTKEQDLINVLTHQRNQALDAAAEMQAMLIGLNRELESSLKKNAELQKQLNDLTSDSKSTVKPFSSSA